MDECPDLAIRQVHRPVEPRLSQPAFEVRQPSCLGLKVSASRGQGSRALTPSVEPASATRTRTCFVMEAERGVSGVHVAQRLYVSRVGLRLRPWIHGGCGAGRGGFWPVFVSCHSAQMRSIPRVHPEHRVRGRKSRCKEPSTQTCPELWNPSSAEPNGLKVPLAIAAATALRPAVVHARPVTVAAHEVHVGEQGPREMPVSLIPVRITVGDLSSASIRRR